MNKKELIDINLSDAELSALLKVLPTLPEAEQRDLLHDLERLEELRNREAAQEEFIPFVKRMWPGFISGRHHKIMARAFERVARGECKRLIINMPPRHTKSEFASYLLPAWFLGKFPEKKVIQTSHTAELAVNFGRKVRNLVDEENYRSVFPDTVLQVDSKAAGRWNTSKGGDYFAIGVGGAVTGKGADLLIIDDPHSEQEARKLLHCGMGKSGRSSISPPLCPVATRYGLSFGRWKNLRYCDKNCPTPSGWRSTCKTLHLKPVRLSNATGGKSGSMKTHRSVNLC